MSTPATIKGMKNTPMMPMLASPHRRGIDDTNMPMPVKAAAATVPTPKATELTAEERQAAADMPLESGDGGADGASTDGGTQD